MVLNVLQTFKLKESIVTLDALHCQTETVNEIVKGNQRTLYEALAQEFQTLWNTNESEKNALIQDDRGHGRIEQRTAYIIDAKLHKDLKEKWPHIKKFIVVVRDRSFIAKKKPAMKHPIIYGLKN